MKNAIVQKDDEPPKKLEEHSAKPEKPFDPKKAVNFRARWKKHDDEEKRSLPKKIATIFLTLLIPIGLVFFILAQKDRTKTYTYNTFVMEKRVDDTSPKQPYKVTVITIMNELPPEQFECTINTKILPLWVAFKENQNFKITAESDYKYDPKMICSLINESIVVEILEQLK